MNSYNILVDIEPRQTKEGFEIFGIDFECKEEAKDYIKEFVFKKLTETDKYTIIGVTDFLVFNVYHIEREHKQYLFSYTLNTPKDIEVFLISQRFSLNR